MKTIEFINNEGGMVKLKIVLKNIICGLKKDKKYVVEIKEFKSKRSKNANNYLWHLIGELSQKMNLDNEELYKNYIRHYGIFKDMVFNEDVAKTFSFMWNSYGLAWFTEYVDRVNNEVTLRCYYGSSSYNSKQMSNIINPVVEDCRALGIETATPQELSLLCENWKPEELKHNE